MDRIARIVFGAAARRPRADQRSLREGAESAEKSRPVSFFLSVLSALPQGPWVCARRLWWENRKLSVGGVAAFAVLLAAGACFGQGRPGRPDGPARDSGSPGPNYTTKVPGQHGKQGPDVSMLMKVYEPRKFTTLDGRMMEYRLRKPAGYAPGTAYPMVVCLHGIPGEGKGNTLQLLAA